MHELFADLLSKRDTLDLSRAGELFSISDSEIENDLTDVLLEIATIISQARYLESANNQSVIEICVNRITSCIRETDTAERHCVGLVGLLETCLQFNIKPTKQNQEESPHAKISSDIISCIFLNYNKKTVMELALPVAVKFLNKENKELSRNLASYLSLAAIEYTSLLSPYVDIILNSLLNGNYSLARVVLQLYETSSEPIIITRSRSIIDILPKCDTVDKNILLQLIAMIIQSNHSSNNGISLLIIDKLPQFFDLIMYSGTSIAALTVLLRLAEKKPLIFVDYIGLLIVTAQKLPNTICLIGQILATIGKKSKEKAQIALDFILDNLPNADRISQSVLIQEAVKLCSQYPILFNDKLTAVIRQRNLSQQNLLANKNNSNAQQSTTSGNITIVKLNSTSRANRESNDTKNLLQLLQFNQQPSSSNTPVPSKSNITLNSNTASTGNMLSTTVINTTNGHTNHVNQLHGTSNNIHHSQIQQPTTSSSGHHVSQHYTRRPKFGDSRSTGRLHGGGSSSNPHRSMTRLNANANVNNSNLGGLHKSMTRLGSSQQISPANTNPVGIEFNGDGVSHYHQSAMQSQINDQNDTKWSMPSTKIMSGGVTVTTSPTRIRPYSIQGPSTLLGSNCGLGKSSSNVLNQSTGSISGYNVNHHLHNNINVHHHATQFIGIHNTNTNQIASTLSILNTMPPQSSSSNNNNNSNNNQVIISGPTTAITRKGINNKSVTLLNSATNNLTDNHRVSVFEPSIRDTIQHFCEKHLDKIKAYMKTVANRLPPPAKCTIEERRSKKFAKLHFACQARGLHCLYAKTFFSMRTRHARVWIHLMFLDLQSRSTSALSSWDASVSSLKHCWDTLKFENKSFITLATSAFPPVREQDALINELRNSGYFDIFEIGQNEIMSNTTPIDDIRWGCFLCNHPEKAVGFLENNTQPVIEGQLKEKKGKWRLFRRWRTRYFTLSGAHLSCKGSSGDASIDINQIRSVKVSRGARNIPKAFEIFTGNQTLILKPADGEKAEEWAQILSIVVAHSQARDYSTNKTNSLPASGSFFG